MSRERELLLERLTLHECMALLRGKRVGRVVLAVEGRPVVLPVNFVALDDCVVFKSGKGSKLAAAISGAVVAFQVDHHDAAGGAGWSVLVRGRASELGDRVQMDMVAQLGLESFALDGLADHFVKVRIEMISGRRFEATESVPQPEGVSERPDDAVIEEMGRGDCLAFLASQRLGRLGVVVDQVPLVLPMQFALDGEDVVLQTNIGGKFRDAPLTNVSFEVDTVDWAAGVGVSVLVKGVAQDVSDTIDSRSGHWRALKTHTWAPKPADRFLRLFPRTITGRRILAGRAAHLD